jgi:MscS family membrane protein
MIYRLGLALLLIIAYWSVWANAQPFGAASPRAPGGEEATNQLQALTFGLKNMPFLSEHTFLAQPLWKYLASLIYLVLAFFVAWLLDYIVNVWLRRIAARTQTHYDELLLKLVRGPVKVVAFVILLNIGLGMFDWPARAQLVLARALIVVVACSITYVVLKLVDLPLGLWRQRIVSSRDRVFGEQLFLLLSKVTKVAILIAAAALTADNLGIKITSLLAGLSVGGLALGLAAQDTVANLFGAVAIFLDKPFHLGDYIKVEGVDGTVESIGLRSTRIRNGNGHLVTIPNKTMGNAIIINITRRPSIHTEMNFRLACDSSVEKVRRATVILGEIFRASPKTSDLTISFNKITEAGLNIYVDHVWAGTDDKEHFAQMQEWNLQIKQRFEAETIELALPTQMVQLKADRGK